MATERQWPATRGKDLASVRHHHAAYAGYHSMDERKPGWWDSCIGPGKSYRHQQLSRLKQPGGCNGSTGPSSTNPAAGKPFWRGLPVMTVDWYAARARLADNLGIR
jgi:homoserine O-acetyltransferase